jgi:hypothetical protein
MLLLKPGATAIASTVVVALTVNVVHTGELAVGVVPFLVQWITAPGVVSDSITT